MNDHDEGKQETQHSMHQKPRRRTLAEWRYHSGDMRQQELATLAGLHVSTVSTIEQGGVPSLSTARAIANALGIAVDDVAWPEKPPQAKKPRARRPSPKQVKRRPTLPPRPRPRTTKTPDDGNDTGNGNGDTDGNGPSIAAGYAPEIRLADLADMTDFDGAFSKTPARVA